MNLLSPWLKSLTTSYPDPRNWGDFKPVSKSDAHRFARLWLCSGIPYAFRESPGTYQLAREAFVGSLGEPSNHLSMVGSARLGFSLSSIKFGTPFDLFASDFDLFLVSTAWFSKLEKDAHRFMDRFNSNLAVPSNQQEENYWPKNVKQLANTIPRGFIDQKLIPNYDQYPSARKVYRACFNFGNALPSDIFGSKKKVSVRVYENWEKAEGQIGGSLVFALKENSLIVT